MYITINKDTRQIEMTEEQKLFGVMTDKDSERKYFKCQRIVGDNIDLSEQTILIVYQKTDSNGCIMYGKSKPYICDDIELDETGENITFSWLLSDDVLESSGFIAFKVLVKGVDENGIVKTKWSTMLQIGFVADSIEEGELFESEEQKDDFIGLLKKVNAMYKTMGKKLTQPEEVKEGQMFRIKTINEDGTLELEAVDMPSGGSSIDDILVDGNSIINENGVANIPIVENGGTLTYGLFRILLNTYSGLEVKSVIGYPNILKVSIAEQKDIMDRKSYNQKPIGVFNYDYAVKCAMCDGKGKEWTESEKIGAWSRMSLIKTELDDIAVAGARYYLGVKTELSIVLPDSALVGQEIVFVWYNGKTPSTLSVVGEVLYFDFIPKENSRSQLLCVWEGNFWSVIGMSHDMPVPN